VVEIEEGGSNQVENFSMQETLTRRKTEMWPGARHTLYEHGPTQTCE